MSKQHSYISIKKSQSGMVAIFVSMIMIIVISLVVLGFAQVTRRNQRSTLDTQLSTQAYYAAESGVNDAVAALKSFGAAPPLVKKNCPDMTAPYNFNASGKSTLVAGSVSYSCVLIDPTPPSITTKLGNQSTVISLASANADPRISELTLSWVPEEGQESLPITDCFSSANLGKFPNATGSLAWGCKFAALRTDLVNGTSLSRAGWQANTYSNVLEPINTTSAAAMPGTTDGQPWAANCTAATCSVRITGLSATQYYLRLNAIYRTTTLVLTGKDPAGNTIRWKGSQATIDATGKARDVLRRIVVRVDLSGGNTSPIPNAAIASADSLCKRFSVTPGYFSNDDYEGGNGNSLCEAEDVGVPSP